MLPFEQPIAKKATSARVFLALVEYNFDPYVEKTCLIFANGDQNDYSATTLYIAWEIVTFFIHQVPAHNYFISDWIFMHEANNFFRHFN